MHPYLTLTILSVLTIAGSILYPQESMGGFFRDRFAGQKQQDHQIEMSIESGDESTSTVLDGNVKKLTDLAYGPDSKQKLDVYLPNRASHVPVIIMVHGGAWMIGDKKNSGVVKNKINYWVQQKDTILVSVNYRLVPNVTPLQQAEDVAAAIAYTQQHLAEWGGDNRKVTLMGHSAGAHLVALLAANPGFAINYGAQPWQSTVVLDSAALDIVATMQRKHYRFYDKAFGTDMSLWNATSPFHQLNRAATPMLLVCSSQRPDKPCDQAQTFATAARTMGITAELLPQDKKHGAINSDLGSDMTYTSQVDQFINQHTGQ
jgi:arylformamidase